MRRLSVTVFLILAFSVMLAAPGRWTGPVATTAYACEEMVPGNCVSFEEPRHREHGIEPISPGTHGQNPPAIIGRAAEAALLTFFMWLSHA